MRRVPLTLPLRVGLVGFSWVSLGLHHPTHVLEDAPSFARLRRERWALTTGHLRPSSLSLFHSFTLTFLDSPTLFKSPPHTQNCHPDRSGPIFSFAPFSGASGRVVEGSACLFLCALCVLPSACPEHFFFAKGDLCATVLLLFSETENLQPKTDNFIPFVLRLSLC